MHIYGTDGYRVNRVSMSEVLPIRSRIMDAATATFLRLGFSRASTAEIARLARVSKRDIYAHFADKRAMLLACISERAEAMRLPLNLPVPDTKEDLRYTLVQYGAAVLRELGRHEVLAAYRLSIIDTEVGAGVAQALDGHGREHATAGLIALIRAVRDRKLLKGAEPEEMAEVYLGVLMHGAILLRMVMRVREPPDKAEICRRATLATSCLERLYGA